MNELQLLINQKQGEVLGCKSILIATDWEVIKATELGQILDPAIKNARAEARTRINILETEITELQSQVVNENIMI